MESSKAFSKVDKQYQENIKEKIRSLADNPKPHQTKKLKGRDGWRIRTGDYRIIYEIDDSAREVTILDICHRKDIYR